MDLMVSSIKEMWRIVHNMMPEALLKFEVDSALKDICSDINQTGALNINYQTIGIKEISLDQATSITIY